MLYGKTHEDLITAEQAVLRRSGLVLEEQPGPDPLAETAAKFAAIIPPGAQQSLAGLLGTPIRCRAPRLNRQISRASGCLDEAHEWTSFIRAELGAWFL